MELPGAAAPRTVAAHAEWWNTWSQLYRPTAELNLIQVGLYHNIGTSLLNSQLNSSLLKMVAEWLKEYST